MKRENVEAYVNTVTGVMRGDLAQVIERVARLEQMLATLCEVLHDGRDVANELERLLPIPF